MCATMKVCVIMQGAPGSGKSFIANMFAKQGYVVHSTDSYFYEDGVYKFNPIQLGENHRKNYDAFVSSLNKALNVVVDNTNIYKAHANQYIEIAKFYGYHIQIVSVNGDFDNTHGVPPEKIQQMKDKMECLWK